MKMSKFVVVLLLFLSLCTTNVICNFEGDILVAWRSNLEDPSNVLQSWDATLDNPCTWFHVTCNARNRVNRLDLGNSNLGGILIPQLARLTYLQYMQVEKNNISGSIPAEFGNMKNLVSLGLAKNQLTGRIPASLGNLKSLRFAMLNSNKLTGYIPSGVIQLVQTGNLNILNVSDNRLARTVRRTKAQGFKFTTIIQDPKA